MIHTETDGGQTSVYGPWRSAERADRLASQLRETTPHYSDLPVIEGEDYIVSVSVEPLQSWPGIRAFRRRSGDA